MHRLPVLFLIPLFFSITHSSVPSVSDLPLSDSVSIDGITWRFSEDVRIGTFVNGHYYVVGPVTVSSITPEPENGRNGSVLNIPFDPGISGFDDRVSSNRFREELRVYPPVSLQPGDALISSISVETMDSEPSWLREQDAAGSPVKSVSVLTCLAEPVATDAFRPSYCDRTQKIYYADSLKRTLLPDFEKVDDTPDISVFAEHFERPWLETCFFHFDAATDYQVQYGREAGRAVGIATLLLMCDFAAEEKEPLLINFIQYGIDLWGIVTAGYKGWPAHGGHGSGRKWPIVFSGMLLGDTAMASPEKTFPEIRFGEDMQTMYGECWTGANVVYAGHQGVIDGKAVSSTPGWGPYEHKHPSEWADSNQIGEDYRRCCTSLAWVGEALAAMLLNAKKQWNHDAFFDYVDRWMEEDDSAAVAIIMQERGWDYSAGWARQKQCWDTFVENFWAAYRSAAPVRHTIPKTAHGKNRIFTAGSFNLDVRYFGIDGRALPLRMASRNSRILIIVDKGSCWRYLMVR